MGKQATSRARRSALLLGALHVARGSLLFATWTNAYAASGGVPLACRLGPASVPIDSAPSALHPCAGKQALSAISTSWKWQTKAEAAVTTIMSAIAVLQLEAAVARRRYMALAG